MKFAEHLQFLAMMIPTILLLSALAFTILVPEKAAGASDAAAVILPHARAVQPVTAGSE